MEDTKIFGMMFIQYVQDAFVISSAAVVILLF